MLDSQAFYLIYHSTYPVDVCPCCQAALCASGFVTASSRPWLRIWHLLTGCASDAERAPSFVALIRGQQAYARQVRAGPASRAAARACAEHCAMLTAVLACVRRGGGALRVQDFGHAESFLAFLMDPVSALQPAFSDRGPLLRRVSVFLRGGAAADSARRQGHRLHRPGVPLGSDDSWSGGDTSSGASASPPAPRPPPLVQPVCARPIPLRGEPLSAPPALARWPSPLGGRRLP